MKSFTTISPLVRIATGCSPIGTPSRNVTKVTSAFAAELAAQREGVRRAARRAVGVCRPGPAVLAHHLVRTHLQMEVAGQHQVDAAALESGTAEVRVVHEQRPDAFAVLVGRAGGVGEAVRLLVEGRRR